MLTIKAEVRKDVLRQDGTFNVKVRFCLNKKIKRVATNIYVKVCDLNDDWSFKTSTVKKLEIDEVVNRYKVKRDFYIKTHQDYTFEEITSYILSTPSVPKKLDFLVFSNEWIKNSTLKGAKNYKSAIHSFEAYLDKKSLPFSNFTKSTLEGFNEYLITKGKDDEGDTTKCNRLCSLYIGALRHLYKEAQKKYNDYDTNTILIPNDPFRNFSCPKQQATRKRAISPKLIKKIFSLPYRSETTSNYRRYNLAKDCFILSFIRIKINVLKNVKMGNSYDHLLA